MISNTFEYSLQKINPKLTLPYWDYTIEMSTSGGNDGVVEEPQASSPIFKEDWFGKTDPHDFQVWYRRYRMVTSVDRSAVQCSAIGFTFCEGCTFPPGGGYIYIYILVSRRYL